MPEIEGAENLVSTEPEAPATPEQERDEPNTLLDGTEPEPGSEEPDTSDEPEEELEEVDYSGKKYRIPKELKPALMMQADYTRKTQEVAETRKALETRETEFNQRVERQTARIQDYAVLANYDAAITQRQQQVAETANVDVLSLYQSDPIRAGEITAQRQELQRLQIERGQVQAYIEQTDHQAAEERQRTTAQQLQEAEKVLSRDIPNWGPETKTKIRNFALSQGISEQELSSLVDPRYVKLLHLASVGSQLMTKQAAKPAPAPVKPLTTVTARSGTPTARKPLGEMSMDDYVAARKAGRGN